MLMGITPPTMQSQCRKLLEAPGPPGWVGLLGSVVWAQMGYAGMDCGVPGTSLRLLSLQEWGPRSGHLGWPSAHLTGQILALDSAELCPLLDRGQQPHFWISGLKPELKCL